METPETETATRETQATFELCATCAVCTLRDATLAIRTRDGFEAWVCDSCLMALKAFLAPVEPVGKAG